MKIIDIMPVARFANAPLEISMFYIVCASTSQSSVRIGCPGPLQAQVKFAELEETGVGKVRIFDDAGKRISIEELSILVERDSVVPHETPSPV